MPACCNAMRQRMQQGDEIVSAPPKGNGSSLLVRYQLRGRESRPSKRSPTKPRLAESEAAIPQCPTELPADIASKVRELGQAWADSEYCPKLDRKDVDGWAVLLNEWVADESLPLLVRMSSMVRGSEVVHQSGRTIIPTDNSPAQWSCNLVLRGIVPDIKDIREGFTNDAIPVSFAHKRLERYQRVYHCTLGQYGINKAGWNLCHIKAVGLNSSRPVADMELETLKQAFINLVSPANYFLLPKQWGGLGEAEEFIEGFRKSETSEAPVQEFGRSRKGTGRWVAFRAWLQRIVSPIQ